ncbi:hypothetical protein [Cryobacterium lyxosi]|uniref:Uncharacterized protein n=1 Tax=Cryobacterium lyxosi TaxID=1259228 RepID=A0A4R8ZGU1_9MICO|nr:hypothetical protein [Cryobacterium lyxosi]TFD25396.1 hypothetical protein E3T27_11685 [Cryobacterium lyxosi]
MALSIIATACGNGSTRAIVTAVCAADVTNSPPRAIAPLGRAFGVVALCRTIPGWERPLNACGTVMWTSVGQLAGRGNPQIAAAEWWENTGGSALTAHRAECRRSRQL